MISIDADEHNALTHYGIIRKSGRYPWGSGKDPEERAGTFLDIVKGLRSQGITEAQIAAGYGMNTSQLRDTVSIANETKKQAEISRAVQLKAKGLSNVKIGEAMGKNESSVRALLKADEENKEAIIESTAAMLRDQVGKKDYVDVGKGVELHLGISAKKLSTAVSVLKDEGYGLWYVPVKQLGTNKSTTIKVLAKPGIQYKEVWANRDNIKQIQARSVDAGRSFAHIQPPISISSKRVKVRYAEEGGTEADGVIYVRPGVKDVSLGKSRYAQVRVAVDGSHYLKGMAIYRDDLPNGTDLVFNTNKKNTGNKLDAMKPMKKDKTTGEIDKDDPFGSQIKDQIKELGPDGKIKVTSTMNIVNEEGDWDDWSKTLSSQFLSKQKPALAKQQLDLAAESKEREFREIMALTNPTVKKKMLETFADSADSSAVNLKAAHLPRQATKVILPISSMRPDQVYAPSFRNGEKVVLVRFPHGHISEIPELTVNNRHPEAKKILGNSPDAIGIHSKVAERLSGADFDGDTVLVIPNNHGKIKNKPPLEGLKGFDPQSAYPGYEGMPKMSSQTKGAEMGKVSNLLTDMTIQGAPDTEIERALRHSMVVIDAEKHDLNYKLSAQVNGIAALKQKYQGKSTSGASTIISRAGAEARPLDRKLRPASEGGPIDRATGKLVYVNTGVKYSDDRLKTVKSKKLAETDDARTLISDNNTPIERIYADHSNRLKDLANQARLASLGIEDHAYSPSAARVYAEDVKDLDAALRDALRNAPHERQAHIIGNAIFRQKKEANPDMDDAELKKLKAKTLKESRLRVGAKRDLVEISPRQWEAIQAGAITKTKLKAILDNTDLDEIKKLATPKNKPLMDASMKARAMVLLRGDKYTLAEVADQLGVSVSTLTDGLGDGS